ncbi:MAG: DUF4397 domain-containing protein [Chloroflexi bacterium]|nr:DUF4397 domain-containing protein [Chloroflexota bacterium]
MRQVLVVVRLACAVASLLLTLLYAAPSSAAASRSRLRVFNLADGPVDVYLDGRRIIRNLQPGRFSRYVTVISGIRKLGTAGAGNLPRDFENAEMDLHSNSRYTATAFEGPNCGSSTEYCAKLWEAPPAPPAGYAQLRLINLAGDIAGLMNRAGRRILESPYGEAALVKLPSGKRYNLCPSDSTGESDLSNCFPTRRLLSRTRYTVWVTERFGGILSVD